MKQRYSFLLTPTWLGWLAVCLVFAVACYLLGQWQLDRRESALEEINRVVSNYDQDPVPYSQAQDLFAEGDSEDEWTVVQMSGEYLEDDSLLVRNRSRAGQVGYEQLVPFRESATGDVIVISRGWLPTSSQDGSRPEFNPQPPSGRTEVIARLKPAEPEINRDAPEGQLASVDLAEYEFQVGYGVVQGSYALMAEESPGPADAPLQLARPSLDEGPHLSYSMQWVAFGLLSFVGWGYAARVHARNRDMELLESGDQDDLGSEDPRLAKQERLRESKRLRREATGKYSDEDAEDAWVDTHLTGSR